MAIYKNMKIRIKRNVAQQEIMQKFSQETIIVMVLLLL